MEHLLIEEYSKRKITKFLHEPLSNLILLGEKGIGKRCVAEQIAKNILKTDNLSTSPDFLLITSKDGIINLDDLQRMKDKCVYCPVEADVKVFVIDDANLMNLNAQNSLLKILEDGNATNCFIFVAHMPLLSTIHSRCTVINMKTPTEEETKNYSLEHKLEYDDIMMQIADYHIGLYYELVGDKDYVEDCKQVINKVSIMKMKREWLVIFGMLHEKDEHCFFEKYPLDRLKYLLGFIRNIFIQMVIQMKNDSPLGNNLYRLYNLEQCASILNLLDQAMLQMKRKGYYTKNDFFDLLRYMISI